MTDWIKPCSDAACIEYRRGEDGVAIRAGDSNWILATTEEWDAFVTGLRDEGYKLAVARLRDEDELRRWQATALDAYQRSFMPQVVGELMARYLDAVKESTDG
jgi:hypothetical protein